MKWSAVASGGPLTHPTAEVVIADRQTVDLYDEARRVGRTDIGVLIVGETGTGKDVLARHIHACSARANGPFVRVNCAGLPDSLLESELFGYERGAFTGADRRKQGYFEAATGGTIFLDEIGELSAAAQAKLLHVLDTRQIVRLGSTTNQTIDARVVCATHRDLPALVAETRFRADLFFRISPVILRVAPLRNRPAEIPLLASLFARDMAERMGVPVPSIEAEALALLATHSWPGNARELRNAVERACALSASSCLGVELFAGVVPVPTAPGRELGEALSRPAAPRRLPDDERAGIEAALAAEGGNQTRAALRLGMPRRTLVFKLSRLRGRG